MIRFIAALDSKRGLADDKGIPWSDKIPTDIAFFRKSTVHSNVLMGFRTYQEFKKPLSDRHNYVSARDDSALRGGFEPVTDTRGFLKGFQEDIWVIGGAGLFAQTIDLADELHLTHLDADFHCTKFFPDFTDKFVQIEKSKPITENGITYHFAVYKRN